MLTSTQIDTLAQNIDSLLTNTNFTASVDSCGIEIYAEIEGETYTRSISFYDAGNDEIGYTVTRVNGKTYSYGTTYSADQLLNGWQEDLLNGFEIDLQEI